MSYPKTSAKRDSTDMLTVQARIDNLLGEKIVGFVVNDMQNTLNMDTIRSMLQKNSKFEMDPIVGYNPGKFQKDALRPVINNLSEETVMALALGHPLCCKVFNSLSLLDKLTAISWAIRVIRISIPFQDLVDYRKGKELIHHIRQCASDFLDEIREVMEDAPDDIDKNAEAGRQLEKLLSMPMVDDSSHMGHSLGERVARLWDFGGRYWCAMEKVGNVIEEVASLMTMHPDMVDEAEAILHRVLDHSYWHNDPCLDAL